MGERIMDPHMLIVTGPQGSGNHMFAKLFNLHPEVYGWEMDKFWVGHHTEPFAKYWDEPSKLEEFDWDQSEYYTTSISCPYFKNKEPQIPKYKEFITEVQKYCHIAVAIIGRDATILKYEQTRVRKKHTTPIALKEFEYLFTLNPYFLSMELLWLYKENYLKQISNDLNFPVVHNPNTIKKAPALKDNSNKKYIREVGEQPLDLEIYKACDES